jgi:hypothetical protein
MTATGLAERGRHHQLAQGAHKVGMVKSRRKNRRERVAERRRDRAE